MAAALRRGLWNWDGLVAFFRKWEFWDTAVMLLISSRTFVGEIDLICKEGSQVRCLRGDSRMSIVPDQALAHVGFDYLFNSSKW